MELIITGSIFGICLLIFIFFDLILSGGSKRIAAYITDSNLNDYNLGDSPSEPTVIYSNDNIYSDFKKDPNKLLQNLNINATELMETLRTKDEQKEQKRRSTRKTRTGNKRSKKVKSKSIKTVKKTEQRSTQRRN